MKPSHFLVLLVGSMLPARVMADPTQVTPAQAVERAPQALTDLRSAIEKLKHPPDDAGNAFLNAFTLIMAADEFAARNEPTNAEFLYREALDAMHVLQSQRPDWQPKIVSYRMGALERKLKDLASHAPAGPLPSLTLPGVKPSTPSSPVPEGCRSFEFNGQKYYDVPLSSAAASMRKSE